MAQRRKEPVPEEPARRLNLLMEKYGLRPKDMCKEGLPYHLHKSELSELRHAVRPLTKEKAQDLIMHFFPEVHVEWLMGESNIMTDEDQIRSDIWDEWLKQKADELHLKVLNWFLESFGYRIEEYPEIDRDMPIPDLRKAVQNVLDTGGATYRIYDKDGLLRELNLTEYRRLREKIAMSLAILLEP